VNYRPQVESRTTDKLALMCEAVKSVPRDILEKVSKVQVVWKSVGGVEVPDISIEFK
jgi:hypothetical protein